MVRMSGSASGGRLILFERASFIGSARPQALQLFCGGAVYGLKYMFPFEFGKAIEQKPL
jgi:hypothetical protein